MPAYPSEVDYVWTELDEQNAGKAAEPLMVEDTVSPYGLPPKRLPGAGKNYKAGDKVKLKLALRAQGYGWKLDWRFPKDDTLEWMDVPSKVTGYTTVGELCAALYKYSKAQFPAKFYDLNGEGKKGNVNPGGWDTGPNLIFDYWENSRWRYEQSLRKGKFSWTQDKATVEIPAGTKLKVLGKKPVKVEAPAGSGNATVKEPNKLLEQMRDDIREILKTSARIAELLQKSEEVMKERMKLVHGVNALKATFWACATETTDPGSMSAQTSYGKASNCARKAKEMAMKLPMKELMTPMKGMTVHHYPGLEERIRQITGMSDDMAAEIKSLAWSLRNKLTFSMFFADRCRQFAQHRIEKKLQDDAVWKRVHDQLAAAMSIGHTTLAEADVSSDLGEKLFNLHATMPKKPAASAAEVSQSTSNPTEIVLSMVGNMVVDMEKAWGGDDSATKDIVLPLTLTSVGNLAGPPSLSIALIQAAAVSSFSEAAAQTSKAAGTGKLTSLAEKILASLEKDFHNRPGEAEAKALADNVRKAFNANDQDALFELRKEYGERISGGKQVSKGWKTGILILQILGTIMAVKDALNKSPDESTPVQIMDYVTAGVSTLQLTAAGAETLLTVIGAWREGSAVHSAISSAGLWLGRISAFVGIVVGVIALADAGAKGDNLGIFVACTQIFGNFFMLMGLLTTSVPGLQLVGLAILAAGIAVQIYKTLTEDGGFQPNNANRVAAQVYEFIRSNPFYDLCCAHDSDFDTWMHELSKAGSGEYLPYARNTIIVHEQLKKHGFGPGDIKLLVNTSDLPMDFMLAGATPAYEI